MSTLTYDFYYICVVAVAMDCVFEHRCDKCANIDVDTMTVYVRDMRSLLQKQHSKSKRKDPLLSASVVDDSVIVADPPSSVVAAGFARNLDFGGFSQYHGC